MNEIDTRKLPLNVDLNVVVESICSILLPNGCHVTSNPDTPTLEFCKNYFNTYGTVLVWNGASDKTVFADKHTNVSFRAWHDYIHVVYNLDFTPEDEAKVCKIQQEQARSFMISCGINHSERIERVLELLDAEINGQIEHLNAYGVFPDNQHAFAKSYIKEGRKVCGRY